MIDAETANQLYDAARRIVGRELQQDENDRLIAGFEASSGTLSERALTALWQFDAPDERAASSDDAERALLRVRSALDEWMSK
jgi:hypothetical protein